MKFYILLLSSILLFSYDSRSQISEKLKNDVVSTIEWYQLLVQGNTFEINPSHIVQDFDPTNSKFFDESLKEMEDEMRPISLDSFLGKLSIEHSINHPFSFISFRNNHHDLQKLMKKEAFYFMDDYRRLPKYKIKKIFYRNGSVSDIKNEIVSISDLESMYSNTVKEDDFEYEIIDEDKMSKEEKLLYNERSSFYEYFLIKKPLPIEKLKLEVEIPYSNQYNLQLSTSNPKGDINGHTIFIDSIINNVVFLNLPNYLDPKDFKIYGLYEDGRFLVKKGYSSKTIFSEEHKKQISKGIVILKQIQEKIEKDEFKNDKEIIDYLAQFSDPLDINTNENEQVRKSMRVTFSGPVSKLKIVCFDTVLQSLHFTHEYPIKYSNDQFENPYVLAGDFETEKFGLIDMDGNWIVKPQFEDYFRPYNRFYYWNQMNGINEMYWFDDSKKSLKKLDYKLDDPNIYFDKYVIVEPHTNGLNGLALVTNAQIVVPMKYDQIQIIESGFILKNYGDQNQCMVLDKDLKTIIPLTIGSISFKDSLFQIKNERNIDLYNHKGEALAINTYSSVHGNYSDGLLLVEKLIPLEKEYHYNSKYYFIDRKGTIIIDVEQMGWVNAQPFTAGLCPVKNKNDLWGYANNKGKVVIPFQFKDAHQFYATSNFAYVRLEDESDALIDINGKIVKKLKGRVMYWSRNKEDRKSILQTYEEITYNEYGEMIN